MSKPFVLLFAVLPWIAGCRSASAPHPAAAADPADHPAATAAGAEAAIETPPAAAPQPAPLVEPAPPPAAAAPHPAPVVLLVQTVGEGWTAAMRQRADDMLRVRLGADDRLQLVPRPRVDALGERAHAADLSPQWLQGVGDTFADLGAVLFLRASLQLEQLSSVDAEGRPVKTPKLTVLLQWCDLAGERRAEFSIAGNLLANDQLIAAAVAEFHARL